MVGNAAHATPCQGGSTAGWEQQQTQLGRHRHIRQGEARSHQIGLGIGQHCQLLQVGQQALALPGAEHGVEGFTHTAHHLGGQVAHQLAQGARGGIGQQGTAQHGIGGCRMHQSQPAAGCQSGVGPVFEQQHPGPLAWIGRQQGGAGMVGLQVQGDGTGIGDHLRTIHQHGHLALARQPKQGQLAQTWGDFHHGVRESLDREHKAHLLAKGRVPKLVQLHRHRRLRRAE